MINLFEDFYDDIQNDIDVSGDNIENDNYGTTLSFEILSSTTMINKWEESLLKKCFKKLLYAIDNSIFINAYKLKLLAYKGLFSNRFQIECEDASDYDLLYDFIEQIKRDNRTLKLRFIVECTLSGRTTFGKFISDLINISKHIVYIVFPDTCGDEMNVYIHSLIGKIKYFVNDTEYAVQLNEPKEYHSVFNNYVAMYRNLYNNDRITEMDVIKFNRAMNMHNLYGALLSLLHAEDSSFKNTMGIEDFSLPHVSGTTSQSRYIYTNLTQIDHVKMTEFLNELAFDTKFESTFVASRPKHYYLNITVVSSEKTKKMKNKCVVYTGCPEVQKYKDKEHCVSISYEQNMAGIFNGVNKKEFAEILLSCGTTYRTFFICSLKMKTNEQWNIETSKDIYSDDVMLSKFGYVADGDYIVTPIKNFGYNIKKI